MREVRSLKRHSMLSVKCLIYQIRDRGEELGREGYEEGRNARRNNEGEGRDEIFLPFRYDLFSPRCIYPPRRGAGKGLNVKREGDDPCAREKCYREAYGDNDIGGG